MKIVYLNNTFGAGRGGAEVIVAEEARMMMGLGHEVVVVVCGLKDGVRQVDGIEVREVATGIAPYVDLVEMSFARRLVWHVRNIWSYEVAGKVLRVIEELRPDVVHTHNMMGLGFRTIAEIGRRWPHVHTIHDVQLVWLSGLLPPEERWGVGLRLGVWIISRLLRGVVGSPKVCVFPSKFLLEFYRRYGFFVYGTSHFVRNPMPEVGIARRVRPREVGFLFVGQLERHKGILTLLEVWKALGSGAPKLRIAGSGSMEKYVREIASAMKNVVVLGRCNREQLAQEYARAAWVVVPSEVIENAPGVVAEAQGCGTPIIASRVGGIPERVRDGVNGWLFAAGDVNGLKECVLRAMKMERWEEFSVAGQKIAEEGGNKKHAEEIAALYGFVRKVTGNW
jgi:glycosyltransferase involved in cell wall biosynthesis